MGGSPGIVFLEGIDIFAYGGVSEAERQVGQHYRLDISVEADLARLRLSDSLTDAISYATVYQIAVGIMASREFRLIETRAERIAAAILDQTTAIAVTVRLRKLAPPIQGTVAAAGVEIRRER